jgi:hypothetical protein
MWGDDQINFPRGAYNRCQPYSNAVWGGDTKAPGNGGLVGCLANGLKASYCGFPFWGSDVGGYFTGATMIDASVYLRWLGFGCFSGLMENMIDGKGAWNSNYAAKAYDVDGVKFVKRYKEIADLRMKLIPYIYSLANTSADMGVLMKPLEYMYPDDANTYTIGDEYLFGNAFLVAPITVVTGDDKTRNVYLPAGTWYNFFNPKETHASGSFKTPSTPYYQMPVYVKTNSVYITGQIYAGSSKRWITNFDNTKNVTINASPGNAGDTSSFMYVDYLANDVKKVIKLSVSAANAIRVQAPSMTVAGNVAIHLATAPTTVYLNGAALTGTQFAFVDSTQSLNIPFAANIDIDVTVNGIPQVGIKQSTEPASIHGQLRVMISRHEINLVIPPITGLRAHKKVEIGIFDVRGINIWQRQLKADQNYTISNKLNIGKIGRGAYIISIKTDGILLQRNKIMLP